MSFKASDYANFVAAQTASQERLFLQYMGPNDYFDIIIIGSGMGGGILADELCERHWQSKRILVLEAGSFIYPTHAYNFCRFSNSSLAKHFACDTFWQHGGQGSQHYIHEKPQLNFGGRSIFWSGLIPKAQDWEMEFFPQGVRSELKNTYLDRAGQMMNESVSMGATAAAIVNRLKAGPLGNDFVIQETPRALHQPYLSADGTPKDKFYTEPTGVFNTAELLINQAGLTPGVYHGDHNGLFLLLNHFAEDVQDHLSHYELVCRNTLTGQARHLKAGQVVLAAGSIESPKLLRRSSLYPWLPQTAKDLLGIGLTDHPTTNDINALVTHIGTVAIPKDIHAKIIFYSKGLSDPDGSIRYPFNIEMNVNHEYWHLRENDPNSAAGPGPAPGGASIVDIKFSFGNCLDDENEVKPADPYRYVPEIRFNNQNWTSYLTGRFGALAGWNKSAPDIFNLLNDVSRRVFAQFQINGATVVPGEWYGQNGKGFGTGTVHHAVGTLRMPYRTTFNGAFATNSVVDEDLRVVGTRGVYVCDMSVMPFSSAANPVRTLAALALRLAGKMG